MMDDMDTGSMSGDSGPEEFAPGGANGGIDVSEEEANVPLAHNHNHNQGDNEEEAMALSPLPSAPIQSGCPPTSTAATANNSSSSSHLIQPSDPTWPLATPTAATTSSSAPLSTAATTTPTPMATGVQYEPSEEFLLAKSQCVNLFRSWNEPDQVSFVQELLSTMCQHQHGAINTFLKPMLQRDFIALLPKAGLEHLAEKILGFLDASSLLSAEMVSEGWLRAISHGMLWKKLIQRMVVTDSLWRGLAERRGWNQYLFLPKPGESHPSHAFYRRLYPVIIKDIESIENNWRCGKHNLQRINCQSENSKGVYCLQYDDRKIVSGLRDNTIKVWDRASLSCVRELNGHTGSVLCLQYDDKVIISGSSDSTVRTVNKIFCIFTYVN